ncbi:polyprotein [Elysia marginata]|uniref:Polyprotein n=1 Tax=Elysia marginata TaxID=1093978 RepID=A0AAV4EKT9_9GAST|nr:polyprotein [Elysia marginata]
MFVFGSTQADHDRHLREALQRLESKDFRLQISKCEFNVSRINFLGHIISADGITPDPKNVQPILDAPTLKTLKQVRSFLSMVNYYHDFIKNLSTTAEPLRRLTRKGVKFQ